MLNQREQIITYLDEALSGGEFTETQSHWIEVYENLLRNNRGLVEQLLYAEGNNEFERWFVPNEQGVMDRLEEINKILKVFKQEEVPSWIPAYLHIKHASDDEAKKYIFKNEFGNKFGDALESGTPAMIYYLATLADLQDTDLEHIF